MKPCPECGTPLDEVPLRECATHRAHDAEEARRRQQAATGLVIMEQVSPEPTPRNRYRIVEIYQSVDGARSRLSSNSFSTLQEARFFVSTHGG